MTQQKTPNVLKGKALPEKKERLFIVVKRYEYTSSGNYHYVKQSIFTDEHVALAFAQAGGVLGKEDKGKCRVFELPIPKEW